MIYIFKDTEDKKISKCTAKSLSEAKTYAKEHKINWCTIDILEDKPTVNENLTVQTDLYVSETPQTNISESIIKQNVVTPLRDITNQEWYTALIEELQACIVETSFNARDAIIQGKHFIGKEILAHEDQFSKAGYLKASELIAQSLGKSQRDIEWCIQFVRQYPDMAMLPIGKNWSWHKITQELLPEHSQDTLESVTKPITKADLIQCLKEIKILLQHEGEEAHQAFIHDNSAPCMNYKDKCDFIEYLQDQIEKITGKL
jgi:hypothetical protein